MKQATTPQVLHKRMTYEKESELPDSLQCSLMLLTKQTLLLLILLSLGNYILLELDRRYIAPGRAAVSREINKALINLKANIGTYIAQAQKISNCGDIWTKKGITAYFVGATAHFF